MYSAFFYYKIKIQLIENFKKGTIKYMHQRKYSKIGKSALRILIGKLEHEIYRETSSSDISYQAYVRLPKLSIKLYLFLHSLEVDSMGMIKNVSLEYLQDNLNCCRQSVLKTLKVLENYRFISYSHSSSMRYFNVLIHNYQDMFKSKKQDYGAGGYITVTKDLLKELLILNDVNALRAAIIQIIDYDYHEYKCKKQNQEPEKNMKIVINYKEVKTFLPSYYNFKKRIAKTFYQLSKIFKIDFLQECINLSILDKFNTKKTQEAERKAIHDYFIHNKIISILKQFNVIKKYKNNFINKTISDLEQLSFEYNKEIVLDALIFLQKEHVMEKLDKNRTQINRNSLGSMIRMQIVQSINNSVSLI